MKFLLSLLISLTLTGVSFAFEPSIKHVTQQKEIALKTFYKNKTIAAEIKNLEKDGYKLLSVDVVPYYFVYGEEGPITNFLITEWYGKSEKYGWSPKFVTAKVGTDHFGWNDAIMLDSNVVQKTIRDLK
jgi:hypothetical protein